MKPRILVAGLGDIGRELVCKLAPNWLVVGLDTDRGAVERARLEAETPSTELELRVGDATSALVLRNNALDAMQSAVAVTGSDEANLEFLRLALEVVGIENRFALIYDVANERRYREAGIDAVNRARACASILDSRVQGGHKIAAGIGLGQGEVMEVEVLGGSPVVGHTLAELRPRRWLVGAVYREGTLIVPHGETVLEAGDRVLIVGDPDLLPSIATLIRAGESEFPLQYGSHVVTLGGPRVESVYDEAVYLVRNTRADLLEAIGCVEDEPRLKTLLERCVADGVPAELCCAADSKLESLALEGARHDVGVLIVPPEPLTLFNRVGFGRGRMERILRNVSSPVLVSRGTFPYRRVLLAMAELPFFTAGAELAIDVARITGAELHVCVVHQPDLVAGPERRAEMDARRREIEVLAGLYHIRPHTTVVSGNPVRAVLGLAPEFDLLVLPYPRGRPNGLSRPNVALHLIHRASCSVMVKPC